MFSRRNRRPKSPELRKAWECLDSGDIPGALRLLRSGAADLPPGEVALVVGRAAKAAGFDDLEQASAALAAHPDHAQALFDFGYACVARDLSFLAIPALREVLRTNPGRLGVVRELVSAYEREGRHREAAGELARHEADFADWPDRYLLVFNAVMSGDLALARRQHALLPDPEDSMWQPARERQNRMLERAAAVEQAGPLDPADLRGWQYVIGGTVLGTLSPYGFDAGMAGRYAWLQDTPDQCLRGLLRLRTLLAAAGVRPRSVSLLPDRGSRILGLAAATVLDLPAEPFAAGREDTVVVAYDLNELAREDGGPEITGQLFERAPGQVLHEHASCWTDAPAITADSVTLLHQSVVAPWGEHLRQGTDGGLEQGPADDRPDAEIAADITGADPAADEGDGSGPADHDEAFAAFVTAVRGTWLRGDRARLPSAGPVAGTRFA
ncbi:tetratricopeptide repeat protein [Streptomyces sp. NPDC051636]|uniref:tetratricopeptide repeat protein n=1 Tax=Streptomyces sp. NPDC051636 TaxID=3365663 RepID=UPI00379444DB